MRYLGCEGCMNYREETIYGMSVSYCAANVNYPLKCSLRKRVLNPDIKEFFETTCERYRKND